MIYLASGSADPDKPAILFDSVLGRATLAPSSTADGAVANVLGPQTYDWWRASAMPATLTATLDAAESCDCCALIGDGLAGLSVYVERKSGSTWLTAASAAPADDSALMLVFPAASATQWRIRITGSAPPAIRIAYLGARLIVPESVAAPYVAADSAQRVELMTARSLGGQYLGASTYRRGLSGEVAFGPVPRAWVDGDLRAFRDVYDAGGTFFFAGSPALMPRDIAYCWRGESADELRPSYSAGGYWATVKMGLGGYGA